MIRANIIAALKALKDEDFTAYINALAALGADIQNEYGVASAQELVELRQRGDRTQINLTEEDLIAIRNAANGYKMREARLSAELFSSSWTTRTGDNRGHSAKRQLNKATRRPVLLGMLVLKNYFEMNEVAALDGALNGEELAKLDDKIYDAIQSYETTRQKIVRYTSFLFTASTSIAFGMIESGVAFFALMVAFTNPVGWVALSAIATGAVVFGGVATYVNYCTFKDDVPGLFKSLFGLDRFLQGFLEHIPEQAENEEGTKTKRRQEFTGKQKAILGLFFACFAMPTGLTIGALSYIPTMAIPGILALFGITASATIFMPIAAFLCVTVAVAMTAFIHVGFQNFIAKSNGNFIEFFGAPFREISKITNERYNPDERPIMNRVAKIGAFAFTAVACALSVLGLATAATAGQHSLAVALSSFFKNLPAAVPKIVGIVVGGVISFSSRLFFTVKKQGGANVNTLKLTYHAVDVIKNSASKVANFFKRLVGRDVAEDVAPAPEFSEKVNKVGFVMAIIELPMVAAFYLYSLLDMGVSLTRAIFGVACTTVRDGGVAINSMFEEPARQADPVARVTRLADAQSTASTMRGLTVERAPALASEPEQPKEKAIEDIAAVQEVVYSKANVMTTIALLKNDGSLFRNDRVVSEASENRDSSTDLSLSRVTA